MEDKLYLLLPLLILLLLGSHLIRVSNVFFCLVFLFLPPHRDGVTWTPRRVFYCTAATATKHLCKESGPAHPIIPNECVCVCACAQQKAQSCRKRRSKDIFLSFISLAGGVASHCVLWSDWIINDAIYVCEKDIFTISSSLQRTNNECLRVLLCCIFTCVTREFCPNFK